MIDISRIEIENNDELSQVLNLLIKSSEVKQYMIAQKLNIAPQNLQRMINKKNISLDDANKILDILGYKAKMIIEK